MELGRRIACFTDIHWGKKNDSPQHNQDCADFVEWFLAEARGRGCTALAFMGDWNDNRNKIRVDTMNYSHSGLKRLADSGLPFVHVVGNHDMYKLDDTKTNSLPKIEAPNYVQVLKPELIDGLLFAPWVCPGDEDLIKQLAPRAEAVFGHFEFAGFLMNATVPAPDKGQLAPADIVKLGPKYVFSGHFHKRQKKKVGRGWVHYIGNAFPHDLSDVDDVDRGMMVFDRDSGPEYVNWPDAPTYHRVRLSEALDDPGRFRPRATVVAMQDVALSHEEYTELMDTIGEHMRVRYFSIRPMEAEDEELDVETGKLSSDGVDALFLEHLDKGDLPPGLSRERLKTLYLECDA